jgi:hypothetical protein
LYVFDFEPFETGSIAGGWSLEINFTPSNGGAVPEPMSVLVWSLLGMVTIGAVRLRNYC